MIALVLSLLLAQPVPADSPAIVAPPAAPGSPAPDPGAPGPANGPAIVAPPGVPAPDPGAPGPANGPGAPDLPLPAPAPGVTVPTGSPEPAVSEPAADSPVAVAAHVSPDPSQVGDLIKLEVTAAYPGGYTVNLPLGLDFDPLHLVSVDESEPESTGQGFRKVFTITLQHFAVGDSKVPGFPITYLAPDGSVSTVQVPPASFTVSSLLANEPDPKRQGEDPPVSIEYPNRTAELIIYSGLAALLVGLVGGLLFARWRRRPRPVVLPPPVPAHVTAFQALEELERADLIAKNQYQDYYLELTEIAKAYIEGRFGVPALDRTTDELRRDLERHAPQLAPLKPTDVVRFLMDCDLVKFARFAPPPSEAQDALKHVRGMVETTLPKLEAKEAKPGPDQKDGPVATDKATKVAEAKPGPDQKDSPAATDKEASP